MSFTFREQQNVETGCQDKSSKDYGASTWMPCNNDSR